MKLLVLKHHEEYIHAMGDTIDCISLVSQLCKQQPLIMSVYGGSYSKNIRSFFSPDTNVRFIEIRDYNHQNDIEKNNACLVIQNDDEFITANKLTGFVDIKGLYLKAGLSYDERDQHCPIVDSAKRFVQIEPPSEPYAFIPEGGSSAFHGKPAYTIDRKYVDPELKIMVPPQDAFMLSYVKVIENATEIHCHVTAWWRLIDKLPTKGKLFMHHYARQTWCKPENFEFRKPWTQLLEN